MLTNSASRLFFGLVSDPNEDWEKINALAAPFGVSYENDPFKITAVPVTGDHPLTENLNQLRLIGYNGLSITLQGGEILAQLQEQVALGLVDYGTTGGQLLILSDLGSLDVYDFREDDRDNFTFLSNLARYAGDR